MVIFAGLFVFWLFLVHWWYTVGTVLVDMWRLVHQWSFLCCFDYFWRMVHRWYTVCTVSVDLWWFVHQWFWVFLTIGTVYHSSKTVKRQPNSKKMTIGVPIVTCLHSVRRIHKAAQTPLPCEPCITCAWAVATARRPWAGLTVCVCMDVHASGSRSLPRAATLSSTYWWCL